ncbi:IS21 family transposase [Limnoglobus roseus]|nr:IS21 family transposase [Limnoglobus roseus]
MRTVDDFAEIRRLHRDGLSGRQIARRLGVGRDTVRKALGNPEPKPYTLAAPRPAPTFGPFQAVVDAIVAADADAPPKQRHTAMQVFRRLVREHGYAGSYHPVQRYLQDRRRAARETFVPLDHPPGRRCEADFGHIHVDFPDGRRLVPVLVVTWSYSNAPFAVALPTERTEAVLHGLCEAFAFFGCVPTEVWWDNPTTVAIEVRRGRDRVLHPRYAALASHFVFAPKFCLPATPREKPRVENRVKDLERMWATPVPRVKDLAELNTHLRACCRQARDRVSGGNADTVGNRFERDRAAAQAVPARGFEACVFAAGSVDKYQTVAFDGNRYSVPRRHAFQAVTVKGFIDRVEVVADHQVVAAHVRSYARHERVLNPLHFLVVLEQKPAALDHAPVYRDWHLPPIFATLRTRLEADLGPRPGVRQYIRVLQLLARFPLDTIDRAVGHQLARGDPTASAVAAAAERLAVGVTRPPPAGPAVTVPRPDLLRFNQLLSRPEGEPDDRRHPAAAQGQPEAVEAADHAGRARQAGP